MLKSFFLFILLSVSLCASDVDKFNNISSFLISQKDGPFKEVTFDEYTSTPLKEFTIKMDVDKKTLKDKVYYLSIISDMSSLKYTNATYKIEDHMMIIKLDEMVPKSLYFQYSYEKLSRVAFRFNVITDFEYKYILPYEGILYGLAYGIILSAFIYYLVIYFSTRRRAFIYYSMMQLFVLLSLIGFTYFSFQPFPEAIPQMIVDIFETAAFVFTFLFTKEILNTKKVMPIMNTVLNIFLLLNFLDLAAICVYKYSILYEYMHFFYCFLITTLAGIIAVYKGNKIAVFYTLGWFTLLSFVFSYEYDLIPLSGIYTIHIAAPLESLIFSFALAYMLKALVEKQNEQEKLLIHKSKLASMGEMIDNIAHQWRQPLMHLGYINMNLEMSSENEEFEKDYFIKKLHEANTQIKFMSQTIDDFRDFYKVEKEQQVFSISNACQLAINIISPTLKKRDISIALDIQNDVSLKGYENEYAQVILNFLTNSLEVFAARKTSNPNINIVIQSKHNRMITSVYDNAGGIKLENIDTIFEPHFTTKKRGSGIGLYMSKVIIQSHFNGELTVDNKNEGACFMISI